MLEDPDVALIESLWRGADEAKVHIDGVLDCDYEISHAQIRLLRALVGRRQCLRRGSNGDARMKEVVATERGYHFLEGAELDVQSLAVTVLKGLDAREKQQLAALLEAARSV